MSEFEVNPTGICSICGQEKDPEELSDLDGQLACLDCIAQANAAKHVSLLELAAATQTAQPQQPQRKSRFRLLILPLLLLALAAGSFFYIKRLRHRQEMLRNSVTSLKTEGDTLARAGKLDEALARYEAVLKQLQGRPLADPQLVELYHQAEKSAAAPYLKMVMPRLERAEALLLAGQSQQARVEFRELANFINAHTIQPEISVRERIDRVTDQLRMPRIVKPNWRQEPTIAIAQQPRPTTSVASFPQTPTVTPAVPDKSAAGPALPDTPTPQPTLTIPPTPKPSPPKPPQPISVPDPDSQARALEQIRARFADNYAQRDALGRRALAHLLIITAQQPSLDSTTRFVLLRESRDIATRAGEPRIALAAVDELAKSFLINDTAMRMTTMADSAQNAFTAEGNAIIAETALDLADRMASQRHFEEAYRCAAIASNAAQQSRQQSLITKSAAKLRELKK